MTRVMRKRKNNLLVRRTHTQSDVDTHGRGKKEKKISTTLGYNSEVSCSKIINEKKKPPVLLFFVMMARMMDKCVALIYSVNWQKKQSVSRYFFAIVEHFTCSCVCVCVRVTYVWLQLTSAKHFHTHSLTQLNWTYISSPSL